MNESLASIENVKCEKRCIETHKKKSTTKNKQKLNAIRHQRVNK